MKKIVFSLFLFGALFIGFDNVKALINHEQMDVCTNTCLNSGSGMNANECKVWCASNIYSEFSNMINGCKSFSGTAQDSCRESVLKQYLEKNNITSDNNLCIDSCIDLSNMSGSQCSTWCIAYFDGLDGVIGNSNVDLSWNDKIQCGDFKVPYIFVSIVNSVITIIKIAVPIIIIILGSLDLLKAVMAQKDDEIKKGQQTFIKRLIVGVVVFLVFAIVQMVIGLVAPKKDSANINMWNCVDCFVNGDCKIAQ